MIYDPILVPHLVKVIAAFLILSDKKICIISQTIRQESTINLFKQHCLSSNIIVECIHQRVPGKDECFDFNEETCICIYRLYSHDAIPRQATISLEKDRSG